MIGQTGKGLAEQGHGQIDTLGPWLSGCQQQEDPSRFQHQS